MARRRSFSNPAPTEEAVVFDLDGVRLSNGEPWAESFECVPVAPSGVPDDLVSSVSFDDRGNQRYDQVSIARFIRGVVIDRDVARFDALIRDKDRIVNLEVLGALMMWLSEELMGRPTGRPSNSLAGPPPTTTTSMADASLPVPILATSPQNGS